MKEGANGMPAATPTSAAPTAARAGGSATASRSVPAAPPARLAATATRIRSGCSRRIQPPSGRVTIPTASVSDAIAPAAPLSSPPCRSSSVTTQFPTVTLRPSEAE